MYVVTKYDSRYSKPAYWTGDVAAHKAPVRTHDLAHAQVWPEASAAYRAASRLAKLADWRVVPVERAG